MVNKKLYLIIFILFIINTQCLSVKHSQDTAPPRTHKILDKLKERLDNLDVTLDSDFYLKEMAMEYYLFSDDLELAKILLYGVKKNYWKNDVIKHDVIAILERIRDPICFDFFKKYYLKPWDEDEFIPWRYFYYHANSKMIDFLVNVIRTHKNNNYKAIANYLGGN